MKRQLQVKLPSAFLSLLIAIPALTADVISALAAATAFFPRTSFVHVERTPIHLETV
jgi:hypothetical protein